MPIKIRMYQPGDGEQIVDLAKRVFPIIQDIPPKYWERMELGGHTTIIAEQGRQIVGAIPFDFREFLIRPGICVRAAFAHLVAVDAAVRAHGVGSQMMDFARRELPPHCDALFVYTGHEGRKPYTFYEHNGFIDLLHTRNYALHPEQNIPISSEITLSPLHLNSIGEESLYTTFRKYWDDYAGFPQRRPGSWQKALSALIYIELPLQFFLSARFSGDQLGGYAIIGLNSSNVSVLEIADTSQACELHLAAAAVLARQKGVRSVSMGGSPSHPALHALRNMGFQPGPRSEAEVVAAQVFQFEHIWHLLAGETPQVSLKIWTPQRQISLPGNGPEYILEMKEVHASPLIPMPGKPGPPASNRVDHIP